METHTNSLRTVVLPHSGQLESLAVFFYGFLVIAFVAGSAGGFRATTIGWTSLATLWLATMLVLLRPRIELGRWDVVYVGGLLLFTCWVALSNLWTSSMTSTMHEVARDIAYVGIIASGVLVVRKTTVPALLGGVFTAIVMLSSYALATRLLPDRFGDFDSTIGGYRLAGTITSWNGLAIFAVMGILLALGFATRGERLATRAVGAAALPILASTVFFTFSRGGWLALIVGLVALLAIDPRRLQLIAVTAVLAPWPMLAVYAADSHAGLKTQGATLEQATTDGRSMLSWLLVLSVLAAVTATAAALIERRFRVPAAVRFGFATVVVVAAAVGVGAVWTTQGTPVAIAERSWEAFSGPNTRPTSPTDLSERLFQLSSNGRVNLFRVALSNFEQKPLLGNGAGTFWQLWARDRDIPTGSNDAHSLYLGTASEVGVVGLVLILAALTAPVAAGLSARKSPLVPASFGLFAAWAAHTAVEFDWALVGVTACALLAGVAMVASARTGNVAEGPTRHAVAIPLLVLLAASFVFLVSDSKLAGARDALARERPEEAVSIARDAAQWAPWSSDPWLFVGAVEGIHGYQTRSRVAYLRALERDRSSWLAWDAVRSVSRGAEMAQADREVRRLNPRL